MDRTLNEGWGILFRGHVLKVTRNLKRFIVARSVYNRECCHQDLVKSISKPIIITTTQDFVAILPLTMEDVLSLKILCTHSDNATSFQLGPFDDNLTEGQSLANLALERINIFYYPKIMELMPNVDSVMVIMTIKPIVAMQIKITDI